MLNAIFYARFHPERGPSIIHQYPKYSIIAPVSNDDDTLFNFTDISSYVIPPYELCNRPLSVSSSGHRVLGFPVSLESSKYERNRFTFNVCFVCDETEDSGSWEHVVSKTAMFFKGMEEEDGILQTEERLVGLKWAGEEGYPAQNVGLVYTLLERVMEELNAYGESCVRVNDLHVLNLRLTSLKAGSPRVKAWDVPLLIRPLPDSDEWTWDLIIQRISPHIDGVKHVQRIADLADVELKLVKKAIRELVYHERAMLLDIFHFQAVYTLTAQFAWLVKGETLQDECLRYVIVDSAKNVYSTGQMSTRPQTTTAVTRQALIGLYRDLSPGLSLHDFYLAHESQLSNIDVRRLITFGVIKGFLRRVQKYALAVDSHSTPPRLSVSNESSTINFKTAQDAEREWDRAWKKAAFSSGWATPPAEAPSRSLDNGLQPANGSVTDLSEEETKLRRYLDGKHCMDEICVSMRMSEKKITKRVRSGRFGEVVLFCK